MLRCICLLPYHLQGQSTGKLALNKQTLLPKVCLTLAQSFHHTLAEDSLLLSSDFWLLMSMIVVIPISFLKTLDALRFTSQIALGTVVYLIIVVVGWFIFKGKSPVRGEVVLARFGKNTLSSFPVQVFAFTCAQNIFPIYNELKDKSQARMNMVILSSIGSAAACYEVLGVIGYLTFGSKVGSNIIAMYPATSLVIAIGRLGIVLLVGLSYPLQLMPCRNCIHTLTRGLVKRIKDSKTLPSVRGVASPARSENEDEDEQDPLMMRSTETPGSIKRGGDMTQKKFLVLTSGIIICGFFIALAVDELEVGKCNLPRFCMVSTDFCSARICWVDGIDHPFFHLTWILLLQPVQKRTRTTQMGSIGTRHLRTHRHDFLVSCPRVLPRLILMD